MKPLWTSTFRPPTISLPFSPDSLGDALPLVAPEYVTWEVWDAVDTHTLAWLLYSIGVRSCGARSRITFSECVSFVLNAGFFSPSPGFQVATSRRRFPATVPFKSASLPSIGSTRGDASRPQVAPALTPHLPSFVLPCGGRRLRIRPFAAAPLVCASLLVAAHRAFAHPLSPASQLHAQLRLVVVSCACAMPHHVCRDPTPRVLQQRRFISPASKLDAGGSHGVSLSHTPLPSRQHRQHPRVRLVLPGPCLVATLHATVHSLHRLLSPPSLPRSAVLSCAFSSVRDGSLLTSRTSSNSQAWIQTPTI